MPSINRRLVAAAALLVALALVSAHAPARADAPYMLYLPWVQRLSAPCLLQPALLSPANGVTINSISPLFRWDCGQHPQAVRFTLEVATDRDFRSVVLTRVTSQAQGQGEWRFPQNLLPDTTYYWRARLDCPQANGEWTPERSFTTGFDGELIGRPTLLAPADGAVLSPLPILLEWTPVPGALAYGVFWRQVGGEWSSTWVPDTRYSFDTPAPNSTYEWFVVARNAYAVSLPSATRHFRTRPSPATPLVGRIPGIGTCERHPPAHEEKQVPIPGIIPTRAGDLFRSARFYATECARWSHFAPVLSNTFP